MNLINDVSLLLREARIKGYVLYNSISMTFRKGKTTGTENKLVLARAGWGKGLPRRGGRTCLEEVELTSPVAAAT